MATSAALILSWPLTLLVGALCHTAVAETASSTPAVAVGAQYDTTHVYVAPESVDAFVDSFLKTFGGTSTKPVVVTVTPTPSSTSSQLLRTPVGTLSVFGFRTPIPFPFGTERTGYLVTDLDAAVAAARTSGADVLVAPFADPVGRDAVIQWPGGVNMQLYWHTRKPAYDTLAHVPENRVYVSADRADAFLKSILTFSKGRITSDEANAPGVEIGQPNGRFRRIRLESVFGKMVISVTNGQLPFPYGIETTGYETTDLDDTLTRARSAGASILVGPRVNGDRTTAFLQFPGGYVAEIHAASPR